MEHASSRAHSHIASRARSRGCSARQAIVALALLVASAAWPTSAHAQAEPAEAASQPIAVVATTQMVADMLTVVGGPCAQVTTLMGPGIDPHLYRASAGDVDRLSRAELIGYNGFDLEGQLGAVLARLGQRIPTLALAERIAEGVQAARLLEGEDEYEGETDPHLWGAADVWALGTDVAAEVIGQLRPACAEAAAERARDYAAQLDALHDWALASAASVPPTKRTLVTSHDAFAYFGAAYGFDVAGIEGISTESEASIADIRETVELVLETGVPAIFVETTISPRTIEAVQAAVRDRGGDVVIGGELFGDAMGDAGTPEGTYVGMIRHNVGTVVRALGGEVAAWPDALAGWKERWELDRP